MEENYAPKETFYFPHDYNASQDDKMMKLYAKCGLEGIGAYWVIIELLHQQPDGCMSQEVFQHHLAHLLNGKGTQAIDNICSTLVKTGLLEVKEEKIYSQRVIRNKKYREFISEQRSFAGKISATKRQHQHMLNNIKERKGKENTIRSEKQKRLDLIINSFIKAQGWDSDNISLLNNIYSRNVRPASILLASLEDNVELACKVIERMGDDYRVKKLSWTIETVLKHLPEYLEEKPKVRYE